MVRAGIELGISGTTPRLKISRKEQAIVRWCTYYTLFFLFGKVPLTGIYLQNLQKNFFVATLFSPLLRLDAKFRIDEMIFHLFITFK